MPVDPSSPAEASLRQALTHHLAGRRAEAEALYRDLLAQDPGDAQALGMLAMLLADGPDEAEAEAMLLAHLALRPTDSGSLHHLGRLRARQGDDAAAAALFEQAAEWRPGLAPIHNDLGVSLHRLGRSAEGLAALDQAVAIDPDYADAHLNRGLLLSDLGRHREAISADIAALARLAPQAGALRASTLRNLLKSARRCDRLDMAEAVCRQVIETGPDDIATIDALAQILELTGHPADALDLRNRHARQAGLVRGGRGDAGAPTLLLLGGVGGGHVPTHYLVDRDAFAILSLGLLSPDQPDAPLGGIDLAALAAADVIFNTLGEIEIDHGQLAAVEALCARLGKPVLNPPRLIPRTARDQAAALFAGVADLVVPRVSRATPDGLARLEISAPMLVRPAGDHGGENLTLVRSGADRDAYLAAGAASSLILTQFHDFRSPDGHWRKYRMIFVDRQAHPYHLAIGGDWLVHYWRAEMAAADWKKAEEERFLADWRGVFGARAAAAADAVARRLDLDYGGMDCALLPDGRLLLFEANACMLLHLDEPARSFAYKHRYVPPIREAFSRMVRARLPAEADQGSDPCA